MPVGSRRLAYLTCLAAALCACEETGGSASMVSDAESSDAAPEPSSVDASASDAPPVDADVADDPPDEAAPDAAAPDAALPDAGPTYEPRAGFTPEEIALLVSMANPGPPPPDPTNAVADDPAAAALGQALFFSDDLGPTIINCPFCHPPERFFSGELSYDQQGGLRFRNVPTLRNVAHNEWFFWDGHADTAWAQARTPLEDGEEMASDRVFITRVIAENPALRERYEALFGALPPVEDADRFPPRARPGGLVDDPALVAAWETMSPEDQRAVTEVLANVSKSLAAYTRRLVSRDSRFDTFVDGLVSGDAEQLEAMSALGQRGVKLFIGDAGCVGCHYGPLLSDGKFHNLGMGAAPGDPSPAGRSDGIERVLSDELNAAGPFSDAPDGWRAERLERLEVRASDAGAFRTATLRDVARTSPFGHDGRFPNLVAIVEYKLAPTDLGPGTRDALLRPRNLSREDMLAVVTFLESLTGAPTPPELIGPPQ